MKLFSKYLFTIMALLLASCYFLDAIYGYAFINSNPRNKTQHVIQLKNQHIDYIFLGSSRVENHIDCDIVKNLTGKSCVNLGLQGSKINDAAVLLQILKDNNVTYEKILFQLDYIANSTSSSPAFLASVVPYTNTGKLSETLENKLSFPRFYKLPFVKFAYNDKVTGFREVTMQFLNKKSKTNFLNGFDGKNGVGKSIKGNLPIKAVPNNPGLLWMSSIANDRLLLFTAPYCKEATNRELFIESLKSGYPTLNNYIDLFDEKDSMFVDCGHLNVQGAHEFTVFLTQDLLTSD